MLPPSPGAATKSLALAASRDAAEDVGALARAKTRRAIKIRRWLVDPRKSKWLGYWDFTAMVALVFTAAVTPFEVAFLTAPSSSTDPLFIINRIIDLVFVFDLVLNFILIVERPSQSMTKGVTYVTDPAQIAWAYLCGWFVLDFISVAACAFDIIGLVSHSDDTRRLRILRLVRVFRLVKLARLLRASRVIQRYATRYAIDYAVLTMVKAMFTWVVLAHWLACSWTLQAYVQGDLHNTWLGLVRAGKLTAPYCQQDLLDSERYSCLPPHRIYAGAVYWSVSTLTSIGYGDIAPTPHNWVEQFVATFLMLVACAVWAQTIATFCSVISTFKPEQTTFRNLMDELNRFCEREAFPPDLRQRLRAYFHQAKHLHLADSQRRLLRHMPPSLQGEVSWMTHRGWLQSVSFLGDASARFMIELSMELHAVVFAPNDVAPRGYLYIIQRGLALYRARVLVKGNVWGEDVILEKPSLRYDATARALNFLEAYYISREELLLLGKRHPDTQKSIRTCAIWMALRREVVRRAHEHMAANLLSSPASLDPSRPIEKLRDTTPAAGAATANGASGANGVHGFTDDAPTPALDGAQSQPTEPAPPPHHSTSTASTAASGRRVSLIDAFGLRASAEPSTAHPCSRRPRSPVAPKASPARATPSRPKRKTRPKPLDHASSSFGNSEFTQHRKYDNGEGKLRGSTDLNLRFEILGAQLADERAVAAEQRRELEEQQRLILSSLEQLRMDLGLPPGASLTAAPPPTHTAGLHSRLQAKGSAAARKGREASDRGFLTAVSALLTPKVGEASAEHEPAATRDLEA